MPHVKVLPRLFLALISATQLTACSRTVQWEEEVPLNTGEVIWVKRSVPWALQGGMGNPFDLGMRPNVEQQSLQFSYRGKAFIYAGGAAILWIAISPSRVPVLVAESANFGWDVRNNYYCVTPQYVQFTPDETGEQWVWPGSIDSWLYGLPANLMANIPKLDEVRLRQYTNRDRDQRDAVHRLQSPGGSRIDPAHKTTCIADPAPYLNKNPDWRKK